MKKAYTIIEVLTVIMILAIISSLTMPVLLSSMPNRNKAFFRKAYSAFTQAVQETANNQFIYTPDSPLIPVFTSPSIPLKSGSSSEFNTKNDNYKNIQKAWGLDTELTPSNYFCYAMASIMNLSSKEGTTEICSRTTAPQKLKDYDFETVDGVRFYGLVGKFSSNVASTGRFDNEYEKTIYMDINPKAMGKKDSDNLAKFFTNRDSNPTVFRLYVKANGQIVVKDDIEKTYIQDATSIK